MSTMRVSVQAPDGQSGALSFRSRSAQEIRVILRECLCGCGRVFAIKAANQTFFDRWHRYEYHNERRRQAKLAEAS